MSSTGRKFGIALLVLLLSSGVTSYAAPAIRYVTPTGDAGGLTPVYSTIQDAVMAAEPGDEIRIAEGTYNDINTSGEMRQVVFINRSLILRGGYSADFAENDPAQYLSIIDPNSEGRGVSILGGPDGINPEIMHEPVVVMEGLHIQHGDAGDAGGGAHPAGQATGANFGGGVYVAYGRLLIADCTLTSNTAREETSGTLWSMGGAILASYSDLTVVHCLMEGNDAGRNPTETMGGAIGMMGGHLTVEESRFVRNSSGHTGGAIAGTYFDSLVLRGNVFEDNVTTGVESRGGAVQCDASQTAGPGGIIVGNRFSRNQSGLGGALYCLSGAGEISGNLFEDNRATWRGGAVYMGAYSHMEAAGLFDNNVFLRNQADHHGERNGGDALVFMAWRSDNPPGPNHLRHNTFVENGDGVEGEAILLLEGWARLTNNMVVGSPVGVRAIELGTHELEFTLFEGNTTNTMGPISEIATIHGGAALAADGIHLTSGSAAVNAGWPTDVDRDFDGDMRPLAGGPDIGADESPFARPDSPWGVLFKTGLHPPKIHLTREPGATTGSFELGMAMSATAYNALTSVSLTSYTIESIFPFLPDFVEQVSEPDMMFTQVGQSLSWDSLTPLMPGELARTNAGVTAISWPAGETVETESSLHYQRSDGPSGDETVTRTVTLPYAIPILTRPGNGEILPPLPGETGIPTAGISRPDALIKIFEGDVELTSTTAFTSGGFELGITPARLAFPDGTVITARDCSYTTPSPPSNAVRIELAKNPWCPQRSVLSLMQSRGEKAGEFVDHYFRNRHGRFATEDWLIPRVRDENTTARLRLYPWCFIDNVAPTRVELRVSDDVITPTMVSAAPPIFEFNFHLQPTDRHIAIVIQCGDNVYISPGTILIDPDGYVYDESRGFDSAEPTLNALAGAQVTCMEYVSQWGGWVRWPAEMYQEQVNPQVTGDDGYYAFFTPPGLYYIAVEDVTGFQSWRSPVIEVVNEIVHVNVPLTPTPTRPEGVQITLSPASGELPALVTIPVGQAVEWVSSAADLETQTLVDTTETPVVRVESLTDPPTAEQGWDSGMLPPAKVYRRTFSTPGIFPYTDGLGRTGAIRVEPSAGVRSTIWMELK